MNQTQLASICPEAHHFDYSLYQKWKSHSTFNNSFELALYICEYSKYVNFRNFIRYLDGTVSIVSSVMGLTSAFLTITTLWSNPYFSATSYIYFRVISFLELFHMTYIFTIGLQATRWSEYTRTRFWYWFMQTIGANVGNCCSSAVDFLVVFLSIERAVACLVPEWFTLINRANVVCMVCTGSIIFSAILMIPNCFAVDVVVDPTTGVYAAVPSKFGSHYIYTFYSYFLDTFWFFMAACVIGTAALVTVGMVKTWKHKQSLHSSDPHSHCGQSMWTSTAIRMVHKSHTCTARRHSLQLCYLQFTQALPTALNYVLYTAYILFFSSLNSGFLAISTGNGYQTAMQHLHSSYRARYLNMFVNMSNQLAHCFHFYLYVIFSKRFRNGVRTRFRKKITVSIISPITRNGMTVNQLTNL